MVLFASQHVSSDQKNPGWLGSIGELYYPSHFWDCFKSHEFRILEAEPTSVSWFMSAKGGLDH